MQTAVLRFYSCQIHVLVYGDADFPGAFVNSAISRIRRNVLCKRVTHHSVPTRNKLNKIELTAQ